MTAEDVVELYSGLLARGVRLWVDGGWGIDALLRRQTRQHKDLDAIVAFGELPVLARFLLGRGFALKLVWEENRWAPCPEPPALVGRERPAAQAATAFVLEDGSGREIDFHVVRLDEHGRWTPAWNTDLVFPPRRSRAWEQWVVRGCGACRPGCRCAPTHATRSRRATYTTCDSSTTGSASTTQKKSRTSFRASARRRPGRRAPSADGREFAFPEGG